MTFLEYLRSIAFMFDYNKEDINLDTEKQILIVKDKKYSIKGKNIVDVMELMLDICQNKNKDLPIEE